VAGPGYADRLEIAVPETLLRFTTVEQAYPEKRAAATRARDFLEIARPYAGAKAAEQASRCSQCGVPFCQVHCPLGNNIPDWLKLTAEGRIRDAYELSAATSSMPEICGRICPQDRLCEGSCVIEQSGHGAVTIGAVEKHLTDLAWAEGWVEPLVPGRPTGRSVGIVGAGPAGLTAAEGLRELGHDVTIYDRWDRPGGLLIYGIPGFKLEKDVVLRRTDRLAAGGVQFRLNTDVGRDIAWAELRARHDAILVATGVYAARELDQPAPARGVVAAMDYLVAATRVGFGEAPAAFASGELDARGRDVVVVGGGDTAMDCVRTAIRQGAASVTCLYRRDRANMPGSQREVGHAEEEGVRFEWLAAPAGFESDARGAVSAVTAQRMRLGSPDASGRRSVSVAPEAPWRLPAQLVIKALGYDAEDLESAWGAGLATTRWGTLKVAPRDFSTSLPGVFAVGDIVRGASLVVWAVRDGRDVVAPMHGWLRATARTTAGAAALAA
jgi:glutamate synthase (NADPH/NADH) small chain